MFLSLLDTEQMRSFLAMATKMAMADAEVVAPEEGLLDNLRAAFGEALPVRGEEIFGATNVEPFDTRTSRIVATMGMLVVAYVDEKLHLDEAHVLHETAEAFGLSAEEVERLKVLAHQQARFINDLNALIAEDAD